VMMQRAAFILDVGDSMPMVAVTARRAVIVCTGDGRLAFEDVHGVVEHHRYDAGNLGDQKQPKKPRAEAAHRCERRQGCLLILECRSTLAPSRAQRNPRDTFSLHVLRPSHSEVPTAGSECIA
jgi:hypothetical protein